MADQSQAIVPYIAPVEDASTSQAVVDYMFRELPPVETFELFRDGDTQLKLMNRFEKLLKSSSPKSRLDAAAGLLDFFKENMPFMTLYRQCQVLTIIAEQGSRKAGPQFTACDCDHERAAIDSIMLCLEARELLHLTAVTNQPFHDLLTRASNALSIEKPHLRRMVDDYLKQKLNQEQIPVGEAKSIEPAENGQDHNEVGEVKKDDNDQVTGVELIMGVARLVEVKFNDGAAEIDLSFDQLNDDGIPKYITVMISGVDPLTKQYETLKKEHDRVEEAKKKRAARDKENEAKVKKAGEEGKSLTRLKRDRKEQREEQQFEGLAIHKSFCAKRQKPEELSPE